MVLRWLPWKYLVRHLARAHGFIDPVNVLARLERFAHPSEVSTPLELLRAGVVFHARGLVNTKAIQHNLDWLWPFWVQRQFDPADEAFIPRAFSLTHVNLTHRNWTAVGLPGCNAFPIVDPRGLLTPFFDGWSVSAWVILDDGRELLPAQAAEARQWLMMPPNDLIVETAVSRGALALTASVRAELDGATPVCRMTCRARADAPGWLVIGLRPFNPEGVSLIHEVALESDRRGWRIENEPVVRFDREVERHVVSTYDEGDVYLRLMERTECDAGSCRVGMATAAALFRLDGRHEGQVSLRVDLGRDEQSAPVLPRGHVDSWSSALDGACQLRVPDERFRFLFDAALRSLVLLSPQEVYPGPYTYKRFWFRDAAFIIHAMLCANLLGRARQVIDVFRRRQRIDGYFLSQAGEWDSNGEVLWILRRFEELSGHVLGDGWRSSILDGARWIRRKRLPRDTADLHAGLLPAGFSAEHLGNNDHYYWDDFWGVAGLRAAAAFCERWGDARHAQAFRAEADDLMAAIERSVRESEPIRVHPGIPASPHRRMDSGAIGSIVASYPLQLWAPDDERVRATVDFLLRQCTVQGAFFQEMIHSGLNAYLSLHLAQVLLRAKDGRWEGLVRSVEGLATSTGQWPEAIHPRTRGGCMGDGQHLWAAAEWVLMARNMFVREEPGRLILGSGIRPAWRTPGEPLEFGPAPTPYGPIQIRVEPGASGTRVSWTRSWRDSAPVIEVRLPGMRPVVVSDASITAAVVTQGGETAT